MTDDQKKSVEMMVGILHEIEENIKDPLFLQSIEDTTNQMAQILYEKGSDYSGDSLAEHSFMNFMRAGELAAGTPDGAMIYLIGIKFGRLISLYATPRQVLNESALKSLVDVGNYIVILTAWIKFKQAKGIQ